jgi:hypothetical protein
VSDVRTPWAGVGRRNFLNNLGFSCIFFLFLTVFLFYFLLFYSSQIVSEVDWSLSNRPHVYCTYLSGLFIFTATLRPLPFRHSGHVFYHPVLSMPLNVAAAVQDFIHSFNSCWRNEVEISSLLSCTLRFVIDSLFRAIGGLIGAETCRRECVWWLVWWLVCWLVGWLVGCEKRWFS